MPDRKVNILGLEEGLALARDAKIVAIRWDLIPWCLVLDCDTPIHEGNKPPMRRAWIVFEGISEISWTMNSARLPNGIFGTNPIWVIGESGGFCKYELPVLLPVFGDADQLTGNPHARIVIEAQGFIGAASVATSTFGEFGPDWAQRNLLATEDDFLEAISEVRKK